MQFGQKCHCSRMLQLISLLLSTWFLFKVTSQHPYAEDFIGEPHVFTVDINDPDELKAALQKALTAIDAGQVCDKMCYAAERGKVRLGNLSKINLSQKH